MFIGRSFFAARRSVSQPFYKTDTDDTVGTVIHELAHACLRTSDIPTVASSLALLPNGMPPGGAAVCNDENEDKILAAANPPLATQNADNYGQFARYLLRIAGADRSATRTQDVPAAPPRFFHPLGLELPYTDRTWCFAICSPGPGFDLARAGFRPICRHSGRS